ncbi:MAG: acyl-CoA synthetase [Burkholderiales bacterium]|nr:acyl-CoA synthetase [Burkholderiales bacterium]
MPPGTHLRYPAQVQAERLPPGALPAFLLEAPETRFPEEVNVADRFLAPNLAPGRADRVAFYSGERSITYRELDRAVNRLGNALQALGIREGDPVVLRIPNCLEFPVCALALHRIGAVVVPTNVLIRERSLTHIVRTTRARAIIAGHECLDEVQAARGGWESVAHRIVAGGEPAALRRRGYLHLQTLSAAASERLESARLRRDALGTVFFTSGTTGMPKGCMHLNVSILAGPCIARHMFDRIGPGDVIGGTPPLAFTFGYGNLFLLPLLAGVPAALIEGRSSPEAIFATIERRRVTIFNSVPTAYTQLLAHQDLARRFDLSSLRATLSGSAPMLPATFEHWERRFGTRMLNGMGSSESYVSIFSAYSADPRPGSMGTPLPGWEVRILGEQGETLGAGAVGRLAVRGPAGNLYWGDPERQAQFVQDGWSLTGDLAWFDDEGCYWHACRADDVIKSRGYRVSPAEIEDALIEHPAVFEPAVIGAPDPVQGERIKAFVSLKAGIAPCPALAEELREFTRSRLAAFQVPGEIEFVESLPKTETGKIRRKDLKELESRRLVTTAARDAGA